MGSWHAELSTAAALSLQRLTAHARANHSSPAVAALTMAQGGDTVYRQCAVLQAALWHHACPDWLQHTR
jgi:hypothetical protein